MSSSLPVCTAFLSKSSGKYLQCHADDTELLQLRGDDAVNPYTRFYIEPSTKHDGLVHVRCCYNNKYWVAEQQANDDEWWITGAANKPEDDMSLQSCTLFQLKIEGEDTNTIRLIHSQQGKHCGSQADSNRADGAFHACLHTSGEDQSEYFTVVNLTPMALPRILCLKGDNGKYLRVETINGIRRLIFSANDMTDVDTIYHTSVNFGTAIRFRTRTQGGWSWRTSPSASDPYSWVLVPPPSMPDDTSSFVPVFFGDGQIIGLRSLANNLYCRRLSTSIITDGLAAMEVNAEVPEAKLQWQEPVVSRSMINVQPNISIARVYDVEDLTLATTSATNNTSSPATVKLTFQFTLTETRRWSSSSSLRSHVMTNIVSPVVTMVDSRIVPVPGTFNAMYCWGSTIQKSSQETVVQVVDLPAKTKVTATLTAVTSSYDVPFSHLQADRIIGSGQNYITTFHDGIFTGQNIHSLDYKYMTENI